MCRALGSEGGSLAWCPLSSRASMRLAAAACTILRVHIAHPPRCWATCLAQDGTCQAEADICVGGFSCCATTPALYCQKNTASQVLGTCETVSSIPCACAGGGTSGFTSLRCTRCTAHRTRKGFMGRVGLKTCNLGKGGGFRWLQQYKRLGRGRQLPWHAGRLAC